MGGVELFTAYAKLILEKAGFDRGAAEADKTGKSLADNLSGYMEKAKKVIGGLFSVVAIKKGAEAVWNLAKDTAAAGDKIDKQSQALGMSRKAYQEWAYILSQSGASIDDMGLSMKTMTAAIMENSAETAAGLSKLGLSAAQLQSMSPEEQFETLVKAFQQMPAGAEKSQLAIKLFGRNAQQLMPLLNSSADSVDELRKRAQELGLIMDDDAVDASVAFGDALDDLTATWDALKMKFGAQLLPGFTKGIIEAANSLGRISTALTGAFKTGDFATFFRVLTDEVSRLIPGIVDTTINVIQGLFSNADKLVGIAVSIVTGIATGIQKSIPILQAKLPEIVNTIWNGLKGLVEDLGNKAIAAINSVFGTNIPELDFSGVTDAFQWILDHQETLTIAIAAIVGAFAASQIATFVASINPLTLIFTLIAGAIALVALNWDKIKDWIGKAWKTTVEWVETGWKVVKAAFDGAAEWIGKVFDTTVNWIRTGWTVVSTAFTKAGEWVGEVWDTTVNWLKTGWDTVSSAFSTAGEWVGKAWDTTVNWIQNTWDTVSNALTTAGEWIGKAWDTTVNWLRTGWDTVSSAFMTAGEWVGQAWDTTVKWLRTGWTTVSNAFTTAGKWVGQAWDTTVNWLKTGWDAVSSAFTTAGEWVGKAWDVTINWLSDTWDNVSSAFTTAAAWVGDTAHNISLAWKSTVDSWFTTIKGWLDGSGWKDLTLNIGATVSEWIERIYDWVTNGIDIVARFFGGGGSGSTGNGHSAGESYDNQAGAWSFYNMTGQAPAGLHLNDAGTEWLHNAKGLNYVPYDGYKAILHRGETVLNQAQGREWRQGDGGAGINFDALTAAISAAVASAVSDIQINMDGAAVGNAVTRQVSQNIYQAQLGRRYSTAW